MAERGRDVSEPLQGPVSATAMPSPPEPPAVPVTHDDAVDEALRSLAEVGDLDLRAQVTVFEDVHGALQDRLADAEG